MTLRYTYTCLHNTIQCVKLCLLKPRFESLAKIGTRHFSPCNKCQSFSLGIRCSGRYSLMLQRVDMQSLHCLHCCTDVSLRAATNHVASKEDPVEPVQTSSQVDYHQFGGIQPIESASVFKFGAWIALAGWQVCMCACTRLRCLSSSSSDHHGFFEFEDNIACMLACICMCVSQSVYTVPSAPPAVDHQNQLQTHAYVHQTH